MAKFITYKDLNQRIIIKKSEYGKNEYGQNTKIEEIVFTCWASIREQTLSETKKNIGSILEDSITIAIRYKQKEPIRNEYLIEFRGNDYQILKLNPDEVEKEFTTIIAKKVS